MNLKEAQFIFFCYKQEDILLYSDDLLLTPYALFCNYVIAVDFILLSKIILKPKMMGKITVRNFLIHLWFSMED